MSYHYYKYVITVFQDHSTPSRSNWEEDDSGYNSSYRGKSSRSWESPSPSVHSGRRPTTGRNTRRG